MAAPGMNLQAGPLFFLNLGAIAPPHHLLREERSGWQGVLEKAIKVALAVIAVISFFVLPEIPALIICYLASETITVMDNASGGRLHYHGVRDYIDDRTRNAPFYRMCITIIINLIPINLDRRFHS